MGGVGVGNFDLGILVREVRSTTPGHGLAYIELCTSPSTLSSTLIETNYAFFEVEDVEGMRRQLLAYLV